MPMVTDSNSARILTPAPWTSLMGQTRKGNCDPVDHRLPSTMLMAPRKDSDPPTGSPRALNVGVRSTLFHRTPTITTRLPSTERLLLTPPMAFVDFYQQSSPFNLTPHDPTPPSSSLGESTTQAYNRDPAYDLEDHGVFVDIEDFMVSVLHVPADWRVEWGPVIHNVKRNPDFMKHYLKHRDRHEKKYTEPKESHYESLLLMNDVAIRTAFPTALGQDTNSTQLPLTQFVHIIDGGCILNDGSLIPRLITKGKATQIPRICPHLTGGRRLSTPESRPISQLLATYTGRSYAQFRTRNHPQAKTRLGIPPRAEETKARRYVGPRKGEYRERLGTRL